MCNWNEMLAFCFDIYILYSSLPSDMLSGIQHNAAHLLQLGEKLVQVQHYGGRGLLSLKMDLLVLAPGGGATDLVWIAAKNVPAFIKCQLK